MHWRGLAIDVSTCLVWRLTCWRIFYWRIGGVWPLTCPRVLNNDLSTGLIWLLTCWRIFYWRIGGVWPLTCRLVWIMTCRLVWFGCWQFDGCFVKVLAGFRLLTCQVVWLLPGLAIHPYHNMVTWPHHSMIIPQRDCENTTLQHHKTQPQHDTTEGQHHGMTTRSSSPKQAEVVCFACLIFLRDVSRRPSLYVIQKSPQYHDKATWQHNITTSHHHAPRHWSRERFSMSSFKVTISRSN